MRILLVCLGNICRSPLAEGILRDKCLAHGLDWTIDSAGTAAWHEGKAPDPRSIEIARKNGIDISNQKARQFSKSDFNDFDSILTMDSSNYQNVLALSSQDADISKVGLIMNYVNPGINESVPDPYYNDRFEEVFEMLNLACEEIIKKYKLK